MLGRRRDVDAKGNRRVSDQQLVDADRAVYHFLGRDWAAPNAAQFPVFSQLTGNFRTETGLLQTGQLSQSDALL
jgi:hypothetical protein